MSAPAAAGKGPFTPLLGYSTNVHRGETLADVYRFLEDYTVPVKRRVFGAAESGLELRIGIGSARELRSRRARDELKAYLQASGLVPFSVNAYPLRDFHATRVKEQVYLPSWAEASRARWTNAIAGILADLMPEGIQGSISTLGGCFRRDRHGPATFRRLAANYWTTVEALAEIEETTGKTIVLAAEPEPETTFETARDVIEFFEGYLLPEAFATEKRRGLSRGRIEAMARRLFTVNVDTCHLSVLFDDTVEGLRELWRAGIEVGKLHVTNAIGLKEPFRSREGYRQLRGMDEPRYFHQFCGRDASGRVVWRGLDLNELPERLVAGRDPPVTEIRSHYHVPVHLERWKRLATTREETRRAVEEVLRTRRCSHLVIETYTWPILAREEKLVEGITEEFRWLLRVLDAAAVRPARAHRQARR